MSCWIRDFWILSCRILICVPLNPAAELGKNSQFKEIGGHTDFSEGDYWIPCKVQAPEASLFLFFSE